MFLIFFLALASPVPVQAHAGLVRSDPPNNAVLDQAPQQIRLWFSETVAVRFSSARLLDMNGHEIGGLVLRQDPSDERALLIDLPALGQGVYSLNWKVLSSADGHNTLGLLVFGIQQDPSGASTAGPVSSGGPDPFQAAARALVDVGLCGLFGALAVAIALLFSTDPQSRPVLPRLRRRAAGWALGLAGLAFAAGFLQLLGQAGPAAENGPDYSLVGLSTLITTTAWGQFWWFRQVTLIVVAFFLVLRWERLFQDGGRRNWVGAAILAGLPMAAFGLSSHAAGLSAPLVPVLAGFLHLLAASMWVGGLVALIILLIPILRRDPQMGPAFRALWAGFGPYAALAVVLTFATGMVNTAGLVSNTSALTGSLYGQTLLLKVGLVLLVGLVGAANSLALHPALSAPIGRLLRRPAGWNPFARSNLAATLLVEALLGLAVFVLAAQVASNVPANGAEYRYAGVAQPDSLTRRVDDLVVTLAVHPNQPGPNLIDIRAASTRRPAPAEILRVIARFSYLDETLGTQSADATLVEPGVYRLGGSYLSLPGPWLIEVVVRRQGIPDSLASFTWNVVPPVSAPLGLNVPLATPLWILAGLFLALGVFLGVRLFRKG